MVGYNAPLSVEDAPLRYADDDAVAMARLLVEAGVETRLFTQLDEDTRAMLASSGATPVTILPPTLAALDQALDALNAEMTASSM